jgi:uncharacterized protein involved in exopolysaccharide biosynthesis/Mrp family chromosome partitioning ATPase
MSGPLMSDFRIRDGGRQPAGRTPSEPALDPAASTLRIFEISQLWQTLRARFRFVLLWGVLVCMAVMAVTFVSRMTFRATGRLYLGEIGARSANAPASDLALGDDTQKEVASEIEILRSQSLVTRAMLASGLNANVTSASRGPTRYLPWLLAGRDPHVVDAISDELSVSQASFTDPQTRDSEEYFVRFGQDGSYDVSTKRRRLGHGKLGETLTTAEFSWLLAPGRLRNPAAGASYRIELWPLDTVFEKTLDRLQITAPKQSAAGGMVNVLTLDFLDTSPHRACAFLEHLMHAYLDERQKWKTEDASAAEAFVTEQLGSMKHSLDDVERQSADYRSHNQVVVLGKEADAMIEQLGKYEEQRLAARLEVASLSDVKRALSGPNPPIGAFLLGEASDSVLQGMAQTLTQEREKLDDAQTRFNDVAPEVREQRARVDAQLASVRGYVSSRLARANASLGSLSGLIQALEDKLKTVPGAEFGLAQLERQSEVYSKTYSYLLERQQQAAITKASTLSKNRVLDAPELPAREDAPKLWLRLASFLLGLALGAFIVVAQCIWSRRIETESDAQRAAGTLPLLGRIPARPKATRWQKTEAEALCFTLSALPRSAFVESFRVLRTSMRHWSPDGKGGVFLVTSPCAGDGKTTVAFALAVLFAAEGKRVMLVDSAAIPDAQATDDVWNDAEDDGSRAWRASVRSIAVDRHAVFTLAYGAATDLDSDSHERRRRLLVELREVFDVVIVDGISYPPAADSLLWGELADGVVSVLRLEHTERRAATEHLGRLAGFARSFAVVTNEAGPRARHRVELDAFAVPDTPPEPELTADSTTGIRDALVGVAARTTAHAARATAATKRSNGG